jgi:hypothetical protein
MLTGAPSIEDYLRWLSDEVSGLPSMFSDVNENFASAAIEGALAMTEDLVDLDIVRNDAGKVVPMFCLLDLLFGGSAWTVSMK